jgi:hypothetical protein
MTKHVPIKKGNGIIFELLLKYPTIANQFTISVIVHPCIFLKKEKID